MNKGRSISAAIFAVILAETDGAAAQGGSPPSRPATVVVSTDDYTERLVSGGQVVEFPGDALAGDPLGAYGDAIRPPPRVLRAGLVRPRLNFVRELLKSVEHL